MTPVIWTQWNPDLFLCLQTFHPCGHQSLAGKPSHLDKKRTQTCLCLKALHPCSHRGLAGNPSHLDPDLCLCLKAFHPCGYRGSAGDPSCLDTTGPRLHLQSQQTITRKKETDFLCSFHTHTHTQILQCHVSFTKHPQNTALHHHQKMYRD